MRITPTEELFRALTDAGTALLKAAENAESCDCNPPLLSICEERGALNCAICAKLAHGGDDHENVLAVIRLADDVWTAFDSDIGDEELEIVRETARLKKKLKANRQYGWNGQPNP